MTLRAIPSSSDTSIWVRPHSSRRIILPLSESPLNLEVIPDAPAIDTERRKSEIEIGSKVCLSNFDAEISVLTLSNTSHNQEEWIQISSSPMNRDDSDVVKQTFSRFDPGLCTFRMTDAHCTSTGNIEENLIRFLAVTETAGEYLTNTILEELEKNGLDNHDCRGQGYDNGANMAKRVGIEKRHWVSALLALMPSEINQLMAREAEEKFDDYDYIKDLLLKRFKLSAEIFRQKFVKHQGNPAQSWRDFVF
ncbi:CCHC-type domain-containing protein [Trichonephila clavipes]|nr:CCHC-type domain-containing protein [Trichonephila clavipes]